MSHFYQHLEWIHHQYYEKYESIKFTDVEKITPEVLSMQLQTLKQLLDKVLFRYNEVFGFEIRSLILRSAEDYEVFDIYIYYDNQFFQENMHYSTIIKELGNNLV